MTTVGQQLLTPEEGWQRIDDANSLISYSSNWVVSAHSLYTDGAARYCNADGEYARFNFIGTKLRIIGGTSDGAYNRTCTIYVDDVAYTFCNYYAANNHDSLCFEITGLPNVEHSVKIVNTLTGQGSYLNLDSIDIDATGTILPYNPNPDSNPAIGGPLNLTAGTGDSQVTLSWSAVTGATGYNVKRSTTAGGPYTTVGSNVAGVIHVDTGLTNGTTYYYVVTALNGTNESGNSNEASATPVAGTVTPPTPTGNALLRVTMIDSSEREYRLSTAEIDGFVNWYTRTIGTGISCYALNDIVDNSKEYLAFEKIISFKVIPLAQ